MKKVRPWCGQPSDRGRLRNRTEQQPTQLSCLPMLSSVAPPSLHRKAATDNVLQIIKAHPNWPVCDVWASTSTACVLTPSLVRRDICRCNYAVERGLVVGFCGQPHYCYQPYYPTARFWSPSSYMVSVIKEICSWLSPFGKQNLLLFIQPRWQLGWPPVPDFPGCPGFVPCCPASRQDQPRDISGTPNVPDFKVKLKWRK